MALLIDGAIVLLYFVGITSLGLYMGRREKSLHDFALGGRKMPWYAVMASIIAAEVSAATFLGAPGEGFQNQSLWYVQLVFGMILGRIFVGVVFLRPYYTYKVYTVYDYLDIRFGPWSKNYVSGLFLLMRTLASGTRLFVPSLVMVLAWRMLVNGGNVQFSQQAVTTVHPYLVAIVVLTILTCIYTAVGGIKAVIWTDLIQASLMFGSAIIAILTLLYHIGGDNLNPIHGLQAIGQAVPQMKTFYGYFQTGFEPQTINAWKQQHGLTSMGGLDYVKLILGSEYTVFSALIAATLTNMAYFGTDQDMVQRMLSAESYAKSRRSLLSAAFVDVPVATSFTFIGILLYVYYQQDPTFKPASNSDVFGSYILNVMPPILRGLVLAGVFATAMGSLSTALNALATSATNDWYIPYIAPTQSSEHHVLVARIFTGIFAILMIGIAGCFAYAKIRDPDLRIIPVVLGIGNFIIGPMLGVFLVGMFTHRRGSDAGNMVAISIGLLATVYLGGLHMDALRLAHVDAPRWLEPPLKVAFTWFALIGAVVVFAVSICFRTPQDVLDVARRNAELARSDDRPVSVRSR